jgi:predicted acylesterase/phospholipase RssA
LRLALTLPGGISLGTFEAGAVCALIRAVQHINARDPDRVRVDVMAGASAGALTSVLAARALLAGEDPLPSLRRAWVTEPSLSALLAHGPRAPLTLRRAHAVADDVLERSAPVSDVPRQPSPVMLDMALVSLRGLPLQIPRRDGTSAIASYLDHGRHVLQPIAAGTLPEPEQGAAWTHAVEGALASASHPLAFPPRLLHRARPSEGDEPQRLWYTDGGLLDNQPLGRCLDCVAEMDRDEGSSRLVVLIHAGATPPPEAADPAGTERVQPRWTETLARSLDVVATHNAGTDLEHLEKTNNRLRWIADASVAIAGLLADDEVAARGQLDAVLDRVRREQRPRAPTAGPPTDAPLAAVVETTLRTAAGLDHMRIVDVAVIGRPRPDPRAGHRTHVAALLDPRRRRQEFAAGYERMLTWMSARDGLRAAGLPADLVDGACRAVGRHWRDAAGATPVPRGWRAPLLTARVRLVRLFLRALHVGLRDVAAMRRRARRSRARRR